MRFRIGQQTYHTATADRLTLRQWMQIEQETAAIGKPLTYTDVRGLVDRIVSLPEDEADRDPDFLWFIALMIWASRTDAGEVISLMDAVDFPLDQLEFLPKPADHKKAADPRKPRSGKGSGRGAKPPVAAPPALAAPETPSASATP